MNRELEEFLGAATGILQMAEVVSQEINKAMEKYPGRAEHLYNSFMSFGSSMDFELFSEASPEVWRSHVAEMLERIAKWPPKNEREMGTRAEALMTLSKASLIAPLTNDGTMAMWQLFEEIMGSEYVEARASEFGVTRSPSSPTAVEEIIDIVRKRCSRERNFPTDEYIAKKRQEDVKRGNVMPWRKYASVPVQLNLGGLDV